MTLYLVRWPRLKASLVSARNEDELRVILDEVADARGARWTEYKGPLWLDLDLPAAASTEEGSDIDAAAIVAAREVPLRVRFGETEAGQAMREVIARWTVPHTQAVVDALTDAIEEGADDATADDAARLQNWRERVASASEADEAEMTVFAHQRREREAELRDPERRFAREELCAAIDRLATSLVGGRASSRPNLTLVRGDDED